MRTRTVSQALVVLAVVSITFMYTMYSLNKQRLSVKPRSAGVERDAQKEKSEYFIPSDDILDRMNNTQLLYLAIKFTDHFDVLCRQQVRVGSMLDGGKQICVDETLTPKYKDCIVYSFGSQNEFSFERDAIRLFGCEVHTFDPYASGSRSPKDCTYHHIGIGGKDETREHKGKHKWKTLQFMTFKTIVEYLGHTQSIIDILKMDVEGSEWDFFEDVLGGNLLTNHVKQIVIEIHFPVDQDQTSEFRRILSLLRRLHETGFLVTGREFNVFCTQCIKYVPELKMHLSVATEFTFLNRRFL